MECVSDINSTPNGPSSNFFEIGISIRSIVSDKFASVNFRRINEPAKGDAYTGHSNLSQR